MLCCAVVLSVVIHAVLDCAVNALDVITSTSLFGFVHFDNLPFGSRKRFLLSISAQFHKIAEIAINAVCDKNLGNK
jgi:hypothetical protein